MAKRRRLTAPDAEDLRALESSFAAKPLETKSMTPPIAHVAGEAAALAGMVAVADRVEAARDAADAQRWRTSASAGLVAQLIPVAKIDPDHIRRDRISDSAQDAAELIASIRASGLRTPIEVVATDDGFGLIAGYRRMRAFQQLAASVGAGVGAGEGGGGGYDKIPAFVRAAGDGAQAYVNMVEENEVRANLTHYERGRIVVLTVAQGVFATSDDAVNTLFAAASKAKRSKVRSFAAVHEALGDLLQFPTALSEKAGLRLAAALRDGAQTQLRAALDGAGCASAAQEWRLLERALREGAEARKDPARGGRPTAPKVTRTATLARGGALHAELTARGCRIDISDRPINPDTAERILQQIQRLLD